MSGDTEDLADVDSLEDLLKYGGDPSKMPSTKELLKMLETSDIPEELRENLKTMLTGNVPQIFTGYGSMLAIFFVILIFLFIPMAAEEGQGISLDLGGGDFKEKLSETIQNLDIKTVLEKMVGAAPDGEGSSEAQEGIKSMLEKYEAMTDEEKADFTAKIKEGLKQKLMNFNIGDHVDLSGVQKAISDAIAYKLQIAAIVVGVIALLFFILIVFCGYKLYKSIKNKEIKREEKKKAKELKKKK